MLRVVIAILTCLSASTSAALADCNPPPPGMSFDQWSDVCSNEIDYYYQLYGGGMNYDSFVDGLFNMYLNPPQQGGNSNGGVTPMAACSPEGATQCNSSGWLYTCTNGQWLTGSVQCGG